MCNNRSRGCGGEHHAKHDESKQFEMHPDRTKYSEPKFLWRRDSPKPIVPDGGGSFFVVVLVSFLTKLSEIRFFVCRFFRNFCSCFANVFSCGKTLQVCCVSEQGGGLQGIRIRRVKTEGHVRSHLWHKLQQAERWRPGGCTLTSRYISFNPRNCTSITWPGPSPPLIGLSYGTAAGAVPGCSGCGCGCAAVSRGRFRNLAEGVAGARGMRRWSVDLESETGPAFPAFGAAAGETGLDWILEEDPDSGGVDRFRARALLPTEVSPTVYRWNLLHQTDCCWCRSDSPVPPLLRFHRWTS